MRLSSLPTRDVASVAPPPAAGASELPADPARLARRAVHTIHDALGPSGVVMLAGAPAVDPALRLQSATQLRGETRALAGKLGALGVAGGLLIGGAIAIAGGPVGAVAVCALFGGAVGGGALMEDLVRDDADVRQARAELLDAATRAVEAELQAA
jgi:hypothetical protein